MVKPYWIAAFAGDVKNRVQGTFDSEIECQKYCDQMNPNLPKWQSKLLPVEIKEDELSDDR